MYCLRTEAHGERADGSAVQGADERDRDGALLALGGQFIHIEPGEIHYVINNYDRPIKMVSTLAPYQAVDKVEVPDYKY